MSEQIQRRCILDGGYQSLLLTVVQPQQNLKILSNAINKKNIMLTKKENISSFAQTNFGDFSLHTTA
jgi:hypothetical protein